MLLVGVGFMFITAYIFVWTMLNVSTEPYTRPARQFSYSLALMTFGLSVAFMARATDHEWFIVLGVVALFAGAGGINRFRTADPREIWRHFR